MDTIIQEKTNTIFTQQRVVKTVEQPKIGATGPQGPQGETGPEGSVSDTVSKLKIGSETDYTDFDVNGHQTLGGSATVFKDKLQSLLVQLKNNPSDKLEINVAEGTLDFKDTATPDDYAIMNVQMNHDWKLRSTIFPHLHWFQSFSEIPNWLVQYRWQINGALKTDSWTYLPLDALVFTRTTGTLLQISVNNIGIVPPAEAGLSDILQLRICRDTANTSGEFTGADTLVGLAPSINFDVHYELNSLGSNTEYSK